MAMAQKSISSQIIYTDKAHLRKFKRLPVLQVRYPCIGCLRKDEHGALDRSVKAEMMIKA